MTWLSLKQVCELTGWTARHVRRIAERDKWQTQISESRGRNGKPEREYLLTSLPGDAQARFLQKGRSLAVSETAITKQSETLPLFPPSQEIPQSARIALDADDLKEVDRRFAIIAPLVDYREGKNVRSRSIALPNGEKVSNLDDLAQWVAAQHDISKSLVWLWLTRYIKGGRFALAPKIRKDDGKSRFFEAHPAAGIFLQQKFCGEGLNRLHAWEALCREWPKKFGKGEPPSFATARRYLATIPLGVTTLGRQGAEAYTNRVSPHIIRGPVPVMQWWISDHRQHDVFVRNTLFSHLKRDEMYRPWLTAIYDWGSRKLVGFVWSPNPNADTIKTALRAPALEFGFPQHFYWDNGKDYKKVKRQFAEIEIPSQVGDVLRMGGALVTSALPKHPRSKPVESHFVLWSLRFDHIWGVAYAGNKPENCRPECRQAQKQHAEYLCGKRRTSPLPSDAEFVRSAVQWVEEYNSRPLECLNGKSPNEIFDEQFPPERRRPVNPLEVNKLLSDSVERTILAGGCVEIERLRYEPDEQSFAQVGRRLKILRDPYNLGIAAAVDERGHHVGSFQLQQFVSQDPADPLTREKMKAALRRERAAKRAFSDYKEAVAAIAASSGWQSEREALAERAEQLGTGTDGRPALASATPGARRMLPPSAPRQLPSSPFVDDAAARCLRAFFPDKEK